jgi:hypothetical protein
MNQTVMIEAYSDVTGGRTTALEHIFGWMQPQSLHDKRILLLAGNTPVDPALLRHAVGLCRGSGRIDIGIQSLTRWPTAARSAMDELIAPYGRVIEYGGGEYESLEVPSRFVTGTRRRLEVNEKRYVRQAFVARCLAEADLIGIVRGVGLNRFSGIHGFFATILDCVPTKTRTEVLSYASFGMMGEALLDVYSAIRGRFLFGVLDGHSVVEETFGEAVDARFIIAGTDPDELDSYALIASGSRVSYSPFSNPAQARLGKGRRGASPDVVLNVRLDDLRARIPSGFVRPPILRSAFRSQPNLHFSACPADFDTLVCPTGAIDLAESGIPAVRRGACVACGWCLGAWREVSVARRPGRG